MWIALSPSLDHQATAWGWHLLRYTPRVARLEGLLLLEVAASLRLFGGGRRLLARIFQEKGPLEQAEYAWAATSLVAIGLLHGKLNGLARPAELPGGLPLSALGAAVPHLPVLQRAGLRTWGQLRALPREGVARRFGAALVDALDAAWGERPETYPWLALPERFDAGLPLPEPASAAPELMRAAEHLLAQLQVWLGARHLGVLALELEWALDLKRLDGQALPTHQRLVLRTARAVQAMGHLRRLLAEQLERTRIAAPANHLRLVALETEPFQDASCGFLPEDIQQGERLHELVERLSIRLGPDQVCMALPQADWRPERMQRWVPAVQALPMPRAPAAGRRRRGPAPALGGAGSAAPPEGASPATLYPCWLLPTPIALELRGERPWYQGPLRRLTRRQRVETAWWEEGGAVVRDYCIAHSPKAGLLWIYREQGWARGPDGQPRRQARWFLHGFYG